MAMATEMATEALTPDQLLVDQIAEFYDDPLGFTMFAFPWGEPGPLEKESGPDEEQTRFLQDVGKEVQKRRFNGRDPVMPIRFAETAGHGTGKSARGAWLTMWILSTRRGSVGTVTAGTYTQLEEKTWAEIQHWAKLCITAHWFDIQSNGIFSKTDPDKWKVTPQTCKRENAQAFAGQHARTSTSWYMADEASEVPDEIYEVMEGGLTDGEPMQFIWGQPVRNTGKLYRVCFGSEQDGWDVRRTDSRKSRFTNKELLAGWIRDYGEDDDFVRVRVYGLPPRASELQFIGAERVAEAQKRAPACLDTDPLIAGVDVSGGGSAWTVCRFRKGLNGRIREPIRLTGTQSQDRGLIVAKLAEVLADKRPGHEVAAMFIDTAFGAAVAVALQNLGYTNVFEVAFGGPSPSRHQLNMRAYMWNKAKDWLAHGSIPPEKEDAKLAKDLQGPGYRINPASKLVIESKESMRERGEASPDDADAFVLTFAQEVAPVRKPPPLRELRYPGQSSAFSM